MLQTALLYRLTTVMILCISGVNAQETQFCPSWVELQDSHNNIDIPMCATSVTIGVSTTIPDIVKGTIDDAVKLYRMVPNTNDLVQIKATVTVNKDDGEITITPEEPFLIFDDLKNVAPRYYTIMLDCKSWGGNSTYEKIFVKRNYAYVSGRAKRASDSTLMMEWDGFPNSRTVHFHNKHLILSSPDEIGNQVFSHWEVNYPEANIDPKKANQEVGDWCWPAIDTVIFTAWYKSSVQVNDEGENGDVRVIWDNAAGAIRIDNDNGIFSRITIYNLQGSLAYAQSVQRQFTQITIPLRLQPGVYLAVADTPSGSKVVRFLVHP